jgi:hypothetical protein
VESKVVITDREYEINDYLQKGWTVKFVVAQHVSTESSLTVRGLFCFVIEREA